MTCTCPKTPKPSMEKPHLHHRDCEVYQAATPSILGMTQRMAAWILEHADHGNFCRTEFCNHCPHHPTDSRVACAEYPCSCGLSAILDDLDPSVAHQLEDEDDGPGPMDLSPTT